MKIHLMAGMKDEGPFLLEWIAHHLALGFDRIAIASNDCTDRSDELLARLADVGVIDHYPVEVDPKQGALHTGYRVMYEKPIVQDADWLLVIDIDEFLNVHIGDGSARALVNSAEEDTDILALNWKIFGAGEHECYPEGFVTKNFTTSIPSQDIRNEGVKSFTKKPTRFKKINCHAPQRFQGNFPLVYENAGGARFEYRPDDGPQYRFLRNFPLSKISHKRAQINHYITKSFDAYILRRLRGAPQSENTRYNLPFFVKYNAMPHERDNSILCYGQLVAKTYQRLLSIEGVDQLAKQIQQEYFDKIRRLAPEIDARLLEINEDSYEAWIVSLQAFAK